MECIDYNDRPEHEFIWTYEDKLRLKDALEMDIYLTANDPEIKNIVDVLMDPWDHLVKKRRKKYRDCLRKKEEISRLFADDIP